MDIFYVAAWEIWKQRNGKIFRGDTHFNNWKGELYRSVRLNLLRMNEDTNLVVNYWLSYL
ncbi:hypothetical protein Zm00014a_034093 [Zea mays]|jgi:hypothetical protein|uniref:Uncharacterized protein n=1 Tax=Zea mays TaxID=4577 RepID=A0A3L6E1N6_MAIZE|nr:hypothetical protein Zm00014a_034093 [Zea mays]